MWHTVCGWSGAGELRIKSYRTSKAQAAALYLEEYGPGATVALVTRAWFDEIVNP